MLGIVLYFVKNNAVFYPKLCVFLYRDVFVKIGKFCAKKKLHLTEKERIFPRCMTKTKISCMKTPESSFSLIILHDSLVHS